MEHVSVMCTMSPISDCYFAHYTLLEGAVQGICQAMATMILPLNGDNQTNHTSH